ncbi:MAG: superoxide dismutase [Firmicutes bacterium]|nr:superoxide dismutase [Bacillota bacterium]
MFLINIPIIVEYIYIGDNMYKISPLYYGYSSLEPYIDTHTMGLHYNKHYRNYLNNLNKLLIDNNYDFSYPIEQLHLHIDKFNKNTIEDILFNLGGVLNHELYFRIIAPNKNKNDKLPLINIINQKYGNYNNFKEEFKKYAKKLKGSGYTCLVMNENNEIFIINTQNQDSPIFYNLTPIIIIDMWEHAYYINYENDKDKYIDAFFDILNLEEVNKIFEFNYRR